MREVGFGGARVCDRPFLGQAPESLQVVDGDLVGGEVPPGGPFSQMPVSAAELEAIVAAEPEYVNDTTVMNF